MKNLLLILILSTLTLSVKSQTLVAYYPMNSASVSNDTVYNVLNPSGNMNGFVDKQSGANPVNLETDSIHESFWFDGRKKINFGWNPIVNDSPYIITMWVKVYSTNFGWTDYRYGAPFISFGNDGNPSNHSQATISLAPQSPTYSDKGRPGFVNSTLNNVLNGIYCRSFLTQSLDSLINIPIGVWKFIAIRHDSSVFNKNYYQFFVDTIMIPNNKLDDIGLISYPLINNMSLGFHQTGNGIASTPLLLNGCIDEVRIYSGTGTFTNDSLLIDSLARQFSGNNTSLGLSNIETKYESGFVYPNPTTDMVYFKNNTWYQRVELYDNLGKLIKAELNTNKFDLREFKPGIYFLRTYNKNRIIQTKVIKQ